MKKFNTSLICDKCTGRNFSIHYMKKTEMEREHLMTVCKICSYSFSMQCADAKEFLQLDRNVYKIIQRGCDTHETKI